PMQAHGFDRHGKEVAQPLLQVAGVEHRVLRHAGYRRTVCANVCIRAHEHAEVAVVGAHLPDALGPRIVEVIAVTVAFDGGCGEEVDEASVHANRAGAGPATAVRCREGLVQFEVHDIGAHVAGPADCDQRFDGCTG